MAEMVEMIVIFQMIGNIFSCAVLNDNFSGPDVAQMWKTLARDWVSSTTRMMRQSFRKRRPKRKTRRKEEFFFLSFFFLPPFCLFLLCQLKQDLNFIWFPPFSSGPLQWLFGPPESNGIKRFGFLATFIRSFIHWLSWLENCSEIALKLF